MNTPMTKDALAENARDMICVMSNIAAFEPEDIDGDALEFRFETEGGFDTGSTISITSQCQDAADVMQLLLDALEAKDARIAELEAENKRAWKQASAARNGFDEQQSRAESAEQRVAGLEEKLKPAEFMENADADGCRKFAWEHVKQLVTTDGWTVGDSSNYFGFFCWGWDMRRQFNEQRAESAEQALKRLISVSLTINRSSHHKIAVEGDDEPCYWQRKEWFEYFMETVDEANAALNTAAGTLQIQGGE